jgi:hypothetical protein
MSAESLAVQPDWPRQQSWEERALVTALVTVGAIVRLMMGANAPTIATDPYEDGR